MTDETQRTYTEDEIKAAFWKAFHGSGELWFGYEGMGEKADKLTDEFWQELAKALREATA